MVREHKPEEIMGRLRGVEIVLAQGEQLPVLVAGLSSPTGANTAGAKYMVV